MRPPQVPRRTASVRPDTPARQAPASRTGSARGGAARSGASRTGSARAGASRSGASRSGDGSAGAKRPGAQVPAVRPSAEVVRASGGGSLLVPVLRPTVLATAERFAERSRLRRRLTWRRIAWTAAGATLVLGLGWLTFFSPVLALELAQVEVVGEGTVVDPAAVLAVVGEHEGTPLPRLDTVGLRRDVLDVPGVRAAEVARDWPHGLRITLVSREPVAATPGSEGFWLLDTEGVQVGRSAEPPAGLPVVQVPAQDEGARAMTAVLAVLESLPPEIAEQVVGAGAESEDTVALALADGARVEWGSAEQSALKARVLLTLRGAPASAGAAVFDVSAPTMPITRS